MKMNITIPYYEDNTRISNSNIGYFINDGPTYLKKVLDGKMKSITTTYLDQGTAIHEYLLQPELFDEDYIVCSSSIQKPQSAAQREFCKLIANSVELEPQKQLISAYKECYSIVGRSEEKILSEATKLANNLKSYIDLLKDGRTIISEDIYNKCIHIKEAVLKHKAAAKLLENKFEYHNEFHINWEYKEVKCKSLLDRVIFDFDTKTCKLIDLKTTSKINKFNESISNYDYLRQLCYYTLALKWYLSNVREEDINKWSFDFYIIALSTSYIDNEVRVFKFTPDNLKERLPIIDNAVTDIKWHIDNNLWDHRREYYEGDGCEHIDL